MKTRILLATGAILVASTLSADDRSRFTAASMNAKLKKPGRVVVSNDHRSITAYRFHGDVREALVSLRSVRVAARPFGSAIFNSSASVRAPEEFAPVIAEASRAHGVDPRLVAAVVRRESAWNPNAVSRVGASGLMQLMPATARFLGVRNVFDPRENIFGGTRYLRKLLDTFDGDLDLALAAYNAGPGAVARYRGVPPYRETRAYVAAVRGSYERELR
jgi:soluble lytic murein transglycosylase-like protein